MANKKINQLVLKTTIQSTDLFPLGDPTTGQLFKKTVAELQAAIGGAVISVNGLVGTVVLDTDDIQELASPTNRYFTEARSRAAISLTTTGNSGASTYSNSTGVLNVPTYTLAGLGGITASFLSGGTGITYNSSTGVISYSGTVFTDASIRALVSAGTGLSYNSSTGVFSYSGTVYTDSSIRALISLTTNGSSGASTYNNTTGVLNVPTYTLAGLGGISLTSLSGSAPITYNSSTGAIGITQASTSTNGFLSSTDWNTFNGKQSALTLGNVTEAVSNVLMFPDGQNGKTIGNLSIQVVQAGSTTNGFLSTTDWNTFNNKQNAITLTTTGTSGAATFSSGTLNIPQYQAVLTNPVTGTGTTNYVTKWTSSSAIGNSQIFDNGTNVGVGTSSTVDKVTIENSNSQALWLSSSAAFSTTPQVKLRWAVRLNSANQYSEVGSIVGFKANATDGDGTGGLLFNTQATNGGAVSERMRIDPNGQVGINAIPPTWFSNFKGLNLPNGSFVSYTVNGSIFLSQNTYFNSSGSWTYINAGTAGQYSIDGTANHVFYTAASGSAGGATTLVERMRITSGGNVGIGTTSPTAPLTVVGNTSANALFIFGRTNADNASVVSFRSNSGSSEYAWFESNVSAGILIGVNGAERVRFVNSGNMLLGTTSDNGERLYVSGSIRATGSITANSDARLKKNIERIENALQKVSEISGYTYNTIYDEDRHAGVIAQEIDKVLPEIVNKGNDGLMGVEYGNISALLIEAIKDLKVQNDSLLARLSALEK